MARLAREEVFALDEIAIVHVMNLVVRRCLLLGTDTLTGNNYDHRKRWIERLLERQAAQFGIDLLCFSILSNHFHFVVRSRPDVVETWDDTDVARRWMMLCPRQRGAFDPSPTCKTLFRNLPEWLCPRNLLDPSRQPVFHPTRQHALSPFAPVCTRLHPFALSFCTFPRVVVLRVATLDQFAAQLRFEPQDIRFVEHGDPAFLGCAERRG